MKTDRALLELAAKAAGMIPKEFAGSDAFMDGVLERWNPLQDDGDALRLAVKLRISLIHEQEYVGGPVIETIEATNPIREDHSRHCEMTSINGPGDDAMANTRRAITRAAAQIQLDKDKQ